jgi:hypothetical protein
MSLRRTLRKKRLSPNSLLKTDTEEIYKLPFNQFYTDDMESASKKTGIPKDKLLALTRMSILKQSLKNKSISKLRVDDKINNYITEEKLRKLDEKEKEELRKLSNSLPKVPTKSVRIDEFRSRLNNLYNNGGNKGINKNKKTNSKRCKKNTTKKLR